MALELGNRSFEFIFNPNKAAPAFGYIYDDAHVWYNKDNQPQTGAWRPANKDDYSVNLSGNIGSIVVDTDELESINTSGVEAQWITNNYLNSINGDVDDLEELQASGNAYLAAISGNTVVLGNVGNTGDSLKVNVTNTVPTTTTITQSNPYLKTTPTGFIQGFLAYSGECALQSIVGYSKSTNDNFVQVFDDVAQTGAPVATVFVFGQNNFFIEFGDNGIKMDNGIYIANSNDEIIINPDDEDFFATVVYYTGNF